MTQCPALRPIGSMDHRFPRYALCTSLRKLDFLKFAKKSELDPQGVLPARSSASIVDRIAGV